MWAQRDTGEGNTGKDIYIEREIARQELDREKERERERLCVCVHCLASSAGASEHNGLSGDVLGQPWMHP